MAATRTLTEFLQHSGKVLPEVERGEVVLRRRDGDDVVLVSREHWQALGDSLRALAEAQQRDRVRGGSEGEEPRGWFALPWMSLLHPDDQQRCLEELTATALAALETGNLAVLAETVARWRATAVATWDDDRRREQLDYLTDEPLPLPRP